ncbi:MAG: hypothetical protein COA44_10280 [Arcobacter sp.]|nr:MAG: hypothetical protein COA44_10280 [Arcobacter sp.]
MKTIFFLFFSFSLLFSQTFVYECQNNNNFILEIRKNDAWLFTKDISMSLSRVTSTSGEKYEKEGVVFWSQGYEAMLDTPTNKYRQCANNRYKAVWEDAKLRGNDFRAVGNEPGWYLEIGEGGKRTLLVTDYGSERYELRLARPYTSETSRSTRYRIKGFLDILIEARRCQDSMSGHSFESRVTVKINAKTYKGCGKALH